MTSLPDSSLVEKWKVEQKMIAYRVKTRDDPSCSIVDAELVGGFDISFVPDDPIHAYAVLVVVRVKDNAVVYEDARLVNLDLPYVPGLLAFREAPHAMELIKHLHETHPELEPTVYLFDGNGRLHSRRAGIACHVGVLANVRTIGVAKTPFLIPDEGITRESLAALYSDAKMAETPGSHCPIVTKKGETIAEIVRGAHSKVPLYISIGHRVSLDSAVSLILRLTSNAHIPEPVRQADLRGRQHVREYVKNLSKDSKEADDSKHASDSKDSEDSDGCDSTGYDSTECDSDE